jgi:hypothetical protein
VTWIPLLLSDQSHCLRFLVLRDLLSRPVEDSEVQELMDFREKDPLAANILSLQNSEGAWTGGEVLGIVTRDKLRATAWALTRLGYLGFDSTHPRIRQGAEFLFSLQREDGAWPYPAEIDDPHEEEDGDTSSLQTAVPLRGLTMCGYATDSRAEKAYDWLLKQRLEDGAWPTGIVRGNYRFVGGYRRLAHSRLGCRTNTTMALICLAFHPEHRKSAAAQRGLDLLLGTNILEKQSLGFEITRMLGVERARGFISYFARFDIAVILDLCWRIGASRDDKRLNRFISFILEQQGPYGLWENSLHPQTSRWVTFDLFRSLSRLDESGDWISLEPETPFQKYPKMKRRH